MTTIVSNFLTKDTMVSDIIINFLSGEQLNGLTLLPVPCVIDIRGQSL